MPVTDRGGDPAALRPRGRAESHVLRPATYPALLVPALAALVVLSVAGRTVDGLWVALGACVAIFGARQPIGRRLGTTVGAAVVLLLALGSGMQVADVFLTLILWNLIVAVAGTLLDAVLPLGATGPWSLVLMVDVGSLLGMAEVDPSTVLRDVGIGCAIGVLAALVDGRLRRHPRPAATETSAGALALRVWRVVARFLEGYLAVLLTSVFPHATRDRHPFWPVLVVVLVVSAPGTRAVATRRAVRCLVGALLAVLVYLPLSPWHPPTAAGVAIVVVLAALAAGLLPRHELGGAFVTALLALLLTRPLLPPLDVSDLVVQHGVDAVVAVALSLLLIRLLRPRTA